MLLQQQRKSGSGIGRASECPFKRTPKFVLAYAHRSFEYPSPSDSSQSSSDSLLAATPAAWFSGYNN